MTMTQQSIDWDSLIFGYYKTDYNVRAYYRDGEWGVLEHTSEDTITLPMAATGIMYAQAVFEGLKVFRGKDGKIRAFRPQSNARRMQSSCRALLMPELPEDMFLQAVHDVVKLNERFIPPYKSDAALYLRPIMLGLTPRIGVHAADEYLFVMMATPVGSYYNHGFKAAPAVVVRHYDRVAPLGTGQYKVAANYAGSLLPNKVAHDKGYACEIYLDAREKKYIDECGSANFFGIKGNTYVTPQSDSILPSITNDSLMHLAEDIGMEVERRPIPLDELKTFDEAASCGTGAVISPIQRIDDPATGESYVYCKGTWPGHACRVLYKLLLQVQKGDQPDVHNWITIIE